jgi:hypothetical protein
MRRARARSLGFVLDHRSGGWLKEGAIYPIARPPLAQLGAAASDELTVLWSSHAGPENLAAPSGKMGEGEGGGEVGGGSHCWPPTFCHVLLL